MIQLFGLFLIVLGVLLDEGTTILVCLRGYCDLETNPIALNFGIFVYICLSVVFYILLCWSWMKINTYYKRCYKEKRAGYKLYDVFIFFFCFLIIFISASKIELGYNNIQIITKTFTDHEWSDYQLMKVAELKAQGEDVFIEQRSSEYYIGTVTSISYLKMIFYVICAFLLFRIGYKVEPYEFLRDD